ncbi:ImmA/IrrE family metallo-endopeptidase [Mucilaginibacter sp. KACC 22063]|uniref:ImmA/IrrE family metallo-endopeptidase n=1 Tax=Mucilaginibacter sp. KACC 22063 TaxID=3025666 RepID=UPI0023660686|nr:ImmA/IrrE family metallo-endopeptidase [Mucilaginibacter sp. KACC 22063]WDF55244.1 ImmA/IrrE family metallo-endopeptidase [Mucilaginibacter sp. KACC 22063]
MLTTETFKPNWISVPGDTIVELLEEKKISVHHFAAQMNSSIGFINELLNGTAVITEETSQKLSEILGASVDFWLRREFQYREGLVRLKKVAEQSWLKLLPIRDMINFGWIKEEVAKSVDALLLYFGVSDINEWHNKYQAEMAQVSFRTSSSFKQQPAAVAAWLRQGEIQSQSIECKDWNAALFAASLTEIRSLTKIKEPEIFLPKLKAICAKCGVAIAIVRTPNGCQASGVTKFLSPNRALLMLSFRYLTDDHFWFTFFHEAGHLLLHGQNSVFVEEISRNRLTSEEEKEANEFAAEQLIPSIYRENMMKLPVSNKRLIIGFASKIGVSAGILIGQMQHFGKIEYNRFNSYKRKYTWEAIPDFNR